MSNRSRARSPGGRAHRRPAIGLVDHLPEARLQRVLVALGGQQSRPSVVHGLGDVAVRGAHHRHPARRRLDDRDRGAALAVAVGRRPAGREEDVVSRHRVQQALVGDHAREGDDVVEPAAAHDVVDAPALRLFAGAAVRAADDGHAQVGAALPDRRHRLQGGGDALLGAKGAGDEHLAPVRRAPGCAAGRGCGPGPRPDAGPAASTRGSRGPRCSTAMNGPSQRTRSAAANSSA